MSILRHKVIPVLALVLSFGLLLACGSDFPNEAAAQEAVTVESGSGDALACTTNCQVAVSSGFVSGGETIPLPDAAFSRSDCTYMVGLAAVDGDATSTQINVNRTTGAVTCTEVNTNTAQPNATSSTQNCYGSYIVVCITSTPP